MKVETQGDLLLIPELHARVTLLNSKNEIVARLGDDVQRVTTQAGIRDDKNKWVDGKFVHPHDACFAADGSIYDLDRIMYLRNYLTQLQRATSEGVPVRGYFLWSLMDNFEWGDGFEQRFGLYHVDFANQRRTPKLSAAFYRETIARNAVA